LYGNGAGGFSNVAIGTGVAFAGGTLSATGSGGTVTSVTGTAPVVSSGGSTPAISMAAATTSVNGYLTSTDWTTFNNKGNGTVTSVAATVPSIFSISGSPITTSGTLAMTYSGTALPVANGGTGLTALGAAFRATGASTTCNSGVATLITNTSTTFDTNGCYNNTGSTVTLNGISVPAYSFGPNVGGYYQFSAIVFIDGSAVDRPAIFIYKNGSAYYTVYSLGIALSGGGSYSVTGVVQMNGTSDYVSVYYSQSSGGNPTTNNGLTFFSGSMVRQT